MSMKTRMMRIAISALSLLILLSCVLLICVSFTINRNTRFEIGADRVEYPFSHVFENFEKQLGEGEFVDWMEEHFGVTEVIARAMYADMDGYLITYIPLTINSLSAYSLSLQSVESVSPNMYINYQSMTAVTDKIPKGTSYWNIPVLFLNGNSGAEKTGELIIAFGRPLAAFKQTLHLN